MIFRWQKDENSWTNFNEDGEPYDDDDDDMDENWTLEILKNPLYPIHINIYRTIGQKTCFLTINQRMGRGKHSFDSLEEAQSYGISLADQIVREIREIVNS